MKASPFCVSGLVELPALFPAFCEFVVSLQHFPWGSIYPCLQSYRCDGREVGQVTAVCALMAC